MAPTAWREARDPDDPHAVVVPLRAKRAWMPVALVPGPRLGALPFPIPIWNDQKRSEEVFSALRLNERQQLAPLESKVRELFGAFVQSLRRQPAPLALRHTDWTPETLTIAARIAATAADLAYGMQVGGLFSEDQIWSRADVAALFPWESQEPGGIGEVPDRSLKREGARVLSTGRKPGQLPRAHGEALRLDRIIRHGGVLEGYGQVLEAMETHGIHVTGDVVLDARALGLALSKRAERAFRLTQGMGAEASASWRRLRSRIVRKSWAHRLQHLRFQDILFDRRWDADRIVPRVRAMTRDIVPSPRLGDVQLSKLGVVRLLDAMGPRRPREAPKTVEVLQGLGTIVDRSYVRYSIYKSDGRERWLDVPNPELSVAQKRLVKALRSRAPFAGVATAFEPGRSPALQARIHEGARAAVVVDIADFFGSIRPRHLRWAFHPRKGNAGKASTDLLVAGGTRKQRERLILLLFTGDTKTRWLPQGAPSSPWAANLAAHPMDRRLRAWARQWGAVRYSRYADDLVLSLHGEYDEHTIDRFLDEAEKELRAAIRARGWVVKDEKTRRFRKGDRVPLTLCGVEVPGEIGAPCRLPRVQHRRARAALHKLRCGLAPATHGLLAWAWGATGSPGWLAWRSRQLSRFAVDLAGPLLAESLVAGWADNVDQTAGED
jgi:hypothetical protein